MLRIISFSLILIAHFQVLQAQGVHAAGAARAVMQGTDLSVHARLDSLLIRPGLIAVGPLADLRGEITVLDGIPFVSTVTDGEIRTSRDSLAEAPFLAYAYVEHWQHATLFADLDGLKSMQSLIDSVAAAAGIDTDRPFPFVVSAVWQQINTHVIMRDTADAGHNHDAHHRAKVKFSDKDVQADLVGFYSRKHEGVFTHKGQFIHIHAVTEDRHRAGHLDDLRHSGQITIRLPKQFE